MLIIDRGPVTTLTLNRPEQHNALNPELIQSLTHALKSLDQDDEVNLVILKAHGKSFCAGADLHWMQSSINFTPAENQADAGQLHELMHSLHQLSKPSLAIVEGPAIGGGAGLVACCDMVVATPEANFCFPEPRLGLIPAIIAPYVIQAIGPSVSSYYFLSAQPFSAEKALSIGLVHDLVEHDKLHAMLNKLIHGVLENVPSALLATKQWIRRCAPVDTALTQEAMRLIAAQRSSPEAQSRMRDFFEKRLKTKS